MKFDRLLFAVAVLMMGGSALAQPTEGLTFARDGSGYSASEKGVRYEVRPVTAGPKSPWMYVISDEKTGAVQIMADVPDVQSALFNIDFRRGVKGKTLSKLPD